MTLMRTAALAAFLLSCTVARSVEHATPMMGVWVHLSSQWEAGPPDERSREEWAYARILEISQNGELSILDCVLRRRGRGSGLISPGDGQKVYFGRWSSDHGRFTIVYQLAYESLPPVGGGHYPGPEQADTLQVLSATRLSGGNGVFERVLSPTHADLAPYIESARRRQAVQGRQ